VDLVVRPQVDLPAPDRAAEGLAEAADRALVLLAEGPGRGAIQDRAEVGDRAEAGRDQVGLAEVAVALLATRRCRQAFKIF